MKQTTTPAASASRHTPLIDELAIQLGGVAYEISEGHTSEAGEALDEAIETHTRLAAEIAALRGALDKTLQLVAKGMAEGAYKNIVSGPEYAERVFWTARGLLSGKGGAK